MSKIECNCYSSYTDEDGNTVHYEDCDIVLADLGFL